MAIHCLVTANSITWSTVQPGGIFPVSEKSPLLILNYDPRIELEIAEKILKPFAKEEDALVNIVDNRDGTSEIALYFVVDCPSSPKLDFQSIKALIVKGKGFTPEIERKATKEKKAIVERFLSGTEADFPTRDVERLFQLKQKVGYFLIGIGIESASGSLIYHEWHLRKHESFSLGEEKFGQMLKKRYLDF